VLGESGGGDAFRDRASFLSGGTTTGAGWRVKRGKEKGAPFRKGLDSSKGKGEKVQKKSGGNPLTEYLGVNRSGKGGSFSEKKGSSVGETGGYC